MHIKRVAIEAFLSYQKLEMAGDLTLDPACNLILGKNGSGKSNFLQGKHLILFYFLFNLKFAKIYSFPHFSNLFFVLNFFAKTAITFVLSDRFKNMSKQDKRKMLHEGLSQAAS